MDVQCEHCGQTYRVNDSLAGRAVQCKACQQQFVIPLPPQPQSMLPSGFDSAPVAGQPSPFTVAGPSPAEADTGPGDGMMRLISGGLALAGVVLILANFVSSSMGNGVYLVALALGPIALSLGIGGVISPNILRSAGKYGQHLPLYYKLIAAGFGVVGLIGSAAMVILFLF